MKLASTANPPKSTPATVVADVADTKPAQSPEKNDFLADVENKEFMLFREKTGKVWAFPRGHRVSSKMKGKMTCELSFRTHLVAFGGDDCTGIFGPLLDGRVCAVVADDHPKEWPHIRAVKMLTVKANESEV